MSTPLLDRIREYKKVDLRFHTPSHALNSSEELYANANYDVTELSITDNLLSAGGVIYEAEQELAKSYHTKRTLMLTNGATCGNFIGLNVLKKYGTVLIAPFSHKSINNAIKLFDIKAKYIKESYFDNGLPRPITLSEIEEYLTEDVGAVVLTSPTYFGHTISPNVVQELQKKGLIVFVDEAHGGHFAFSKLLPNAMSNIGDLVVDSLHKTLPVYTGGAVLHINNKELIAETEFYRSILHSSSPNYVTMCSIDYTQDLFCREGERLYKELYEELSNQKLDGFKLVKTDDFTRLVIDTSPYDSEWVASLLEHSGMFVEMNYEHYLVMILSPLRKEIVAKAFDLLNETYSLMLKLSDKKYYIKPNSAIVETDTACDKKTEETTNDFDFILLGDSLGKISNADVGVYPPGVACIKSGEIITQEKLDYLLNNKHRLFGLVGGKICVRK